MKIFKFLRKKIAQFWTKFNFPEKMINFEPYILWKIIFNLNKIQDLTMNYYNSGKKILNHEHNLIKKKKKLSISK